MSKKKCIFYGNCQVIIFIYQSLLTCPEFTNEYDCFTYGNVSRDNITRIDFNINHFNQCDLLIYQPLGDHHGVYGTNSVKKLLKKDCKLIAFPYIYNSALYTVYWERASEEKNRGWSLGTIINCGFRHIIQLIISGKTIDQILDLYDKGEIDFYFEERMDVCIEYLQKKKNYAIYPFLILF